ncbi:MAG TPA: 30S ribosome-binding factor RbfA [Clostridiaceae bacterium]
MGNYRSGRINEEVKKEISSIVQNDLRDPRISAMVSIIDVDVTKDLKYAKVFISLFGSEDSKKETFEALKSSIGFIRKELGHRVKLRITPEIQLHLDTSIEQGMHINSLIQQIKEKG